MSIDEQDEQRHETKCDKKTTDGREEELQMENWPSCNVSNMDSGRTSYMVVRKYRVRLQVSCAETAILCNDSNTGLESATTKLWRKN